MNAACITLLCRVASIVFGSLAAWYWYKASTKKITDKDNNPHNPDYEPRSNPDKKNGHRLLYTSTAMEQSRLNAIAAIHTMIVAALQVVTLVVDIAASI
jgi:hypothetical protein